MNRNRPATRRAWERKLERMEAARIRALVERYDRQEERAEEYRIARESGMPYGAYLPSGMEPMEHGWIDLGFLVKRGSLVHKYECGRMRPRPCDIEEEE